MSYPDDYFVGQFLSCCCFVSFKLLLNVWWIQLSIVDVMIVLVSLFSFSCSSTSSLFFLIFSLSSATLYLTLKSSCVGRSKSNFNSFSKRTGLFTSTCFIFKSFSALRFFSEREDPITVTSFREFNSSKNPSIFWLRSFFALSFCTSTTTLFWNVVGRLPARNVSTSPEERTGRSEIGFTAFSRKSTRSYNWRASKHCLIRSTGVLGELFAICFVRKT